MTIRSGKATWDNKTDIIGRRSNVNEDDGRYVTKDDGRKEKANILSDIKLNGNVTITIVPNPWGKKEGGRRSV
jgi:hypothetical protein